jgi:hypothetical protein
MAKKPEIDEASPWNTPLSGAEKPKTPAEIDAAVASKPVPPMSASEASGEPKASDFPANSAAYYLAKRKWAEKQTSPEAMSKGLTKKKVSGK